MTGRVRGLGWLLTVVVAPIVLSSMVQGSIYDNPGPCFDTNVNYGVDSETIALPVKEVVRCLRTLEMNATLAIQAVNGYKELFKVGYGYYNFNNDVLNSKPFANPYNWGVYNGTSGGQVNYEKAFDALATQIKKDGKADGLLPYEIQDIITSARDAHTSGINNDLDTLLLLSSSSKRWLALDTDASGNVFVVGFPLIDVDEDSVGDARKNGVKVTSINGRDALEFLSEFVENPAIGDCSRFKSPGTRMSCFLEAMLTTKGSIVRWESVTIGDISTLPDSLEIVFEDGETDKWLLFVAGPKEFLALPQGELEARLNSPSASSSGVSPYELFQNMLDAKPAPIPNQSPEPAPVSRQAQSPAKAARDYTIVPGSNSNRIAFTIFQDSNPEYPSLAQFSGYAVVNDTMVWKLTTFVSPSSRGDAINFWNAMVMEAEKKNITKLMIDISSNGGGAVVNAVTYLQMLYQDVPLKDLVAEQNTRITDVMLTVGNDVYPMFMNILTNLTTEANLQVLQDNSLNLPVDDIISSLSNGAALSGVYGKYVGPTDDTWFSINTTNTFTLLDLVGIQSDGYAEPSDNVTEILDALQQSVNPPKYCNPLEVQGSTCNAITRVQGGVKTLTSDFFRSSAYTQEDYDVTKKAARRNPFKEYILLSDGKAGSASDRVQSTMRFLSQKYSGSVPSLVTVGYGGNGKRSDQALTQFSGGVTKGGYILTTLYGLYASFDTLDAILSTIESAGLLNQIDGVSKSDIRSYNQAVTQLLGQLPVPPIFSTELPQYVWGPVYSQMITDETIPQEYWIINPNVYLPFWPVPGTTSFDSQYSLPKLYNAVFQELSTQ